MEQQFEQAERDAAIIAPAGTIRNNVERNRKFKQILDAQSSVAKGSATAALAGPPEVEKDPRYRRHLLAMARETVSTANTRIIGGTAVPPGAYADVVALQASDGTVCSGILIASNVVLTAAHCVCIGIAQAIVGEDMQQALSLDTYDVVSNKTMSACPQIDSSAVTQPGLDVGLVYLDKSPSIAPRAFATAKTFGAAMDVRAIGFGQTSADGSGSYGIKMLADVPVTSGTCSGSIGTLTDAAYYGCVPGSEAVAGMKGLNKDTCQGDSGGPIMVKAANNSYVLAGITSRGTGEAGAENCGDGGIYELTLGAVFTWITVTNGIAVKTM